MSWTIEHDQNAMDLAMEQTKGSYQENLVLGFENLSGSTLKGTARSYGGKYAQSRAALLKRLDAAGIPHGEFRGPNGRRELVIGIGCARL